MQTWKKIALALGGVALVAFALFYFSRSRASRPVAAPLDPAFGQYISSYTAGVISSGSSIRVVLSANVVDSLAIGTETTVKLFSLSPAVGGTTTWLDLRTVEFKPEKRLVSGQVYTVNFALSRLINVPDGLENFQYSVQVIPQNFEVSIENVKPYVKTDLKRQKIEGLLLTADYAPEADVEKTIAATQDSKSLKVNWTHTGEGKQHHFVVEDVARREAASNVQLALNGAPLGIDKNETQNVDIPALGDFKVTNVRVEQGSSQHVVVQFSDPLNEAQNVEGLMTLSQLSSLDFEIKDNEVRIYPPAKQTGTRTLTVEAGVKNILNYKMASGTTWEVVFEQSKPDVRFVGKGSILPSTDGLVLPFEAVNLKAVDVKIIRIFENNVHQFLQVNDLDGSQELRRVGRVALQKKISLEEAGVTDLGKWNRFTLDLATLVNPEPGAIYQVRLNFRRSYLAYVCEEGGEEEAGQTAFGADENFESEEREESYWDSYEDYYYGEDYEWEERENPCHSSYYVNRAIRKNIIATDIGLMAKQGEDGTTTVIATDLKTTLPLAGVQVEMFDYQQQLLGTATTTAEGQAVIASKRKPFVLVARSGTQRGYLKLQDGSSLSLSNFDVGGERVQNGLKGLLYGERGVWRPGDSLYLTFILEDKLKLLPANHPVVFELQNPQGQITSRMVRSSSENGFYSFATATDPEAPTGNWTAKVKVGGTEFTQPLKIEMVKPNRLKINLDFGVDKLKAGTDAISGKLNVKWLHGAPGKNLRAQFEVTLTKATTRFDRYPEFVFDDPTRSFTSETVEIFDGVTDAEGNQTVNAELAVNEAAPGMLNAVFRGKVFEESGNFSIDRFSIPYYPYTSFTGIRLPQGDRARGMLLTDTTHRVEVVTLDADGGPVSRTNIEMTLYKVNWRWWWDQSNEGDVNFMSGSYSQPIAVGKIQTVNGKGQWTFRVKYPEWGRFFVRAYDPESGHSTGKTVYIDWPGWAGRARNEADGATMLSFAADKPAYNIGEKVNLVIPGSDKGRALVSVENGSRVLKTFWLETKKGDNPFSFEVTKDMTPNVFISVTALQPHAQTANDLPIRMYGVIPIQVEDPATHLTPVISMPDVLEPGQKVTIKISEKDKRKMTYTVAVVDEGLLDLTKFKTPDAWSRFYAREALGVRTWDVFDEVIGAFGGKLERLLAIGGDGELAGKEDDAKANRFKPVVKFFGPFTLTGSGNEHTFTMPQYIGSVKTMVVAGYEGAYGSADKATPVRKPLMVLATLPRVLGPEEKVKLPVTLFAQEKSIRNVKVEVKVSGPVSLSGTPSKTVAMQSNDQTVDFDLEVAGQTGVAKIEVTARSGSYQSTDVIEIQVRNANTPVTRVQEVLLEAGKSWAGNLAPVGMPGTNSAVLEVSTLPPVNLGQRLKYLMQYPHGCIEQTTSSVFPQLYLENIKSLTAEEKATVQRNVKAGIERLKLFAQRDGGFAYWPGGENSDSWGTAYAGHFLVEAEARGYFVPNDLLKRWKRYQKEKAQAWRKSQEYYSSELIQAYRLYTLALANSAELSAMNRLREAGNLPPTAAWMLAAAYVKAGQAEAAKALMAKLPITVKPYQEMAYSYGSDLRDQAIILETLSMLGDRTKAFDVLREMAASLGRQDYYGNTQTLAWCLKAIGVFAGQEQKGELRFTYTYRGKEVKVNTGLPIAQIPLAVADAKTEALKMTSENKGMLFVRVIGEGTPARGQEDNAENNLAIRVAYTDTDGRALDVATLEQGQEFIASVTVSNPGLRGAYKNMALAQVFPSGWEINNLRLDEAQSRLAGDVPTYQDIRDDRVYTYFDLGNAQQKTFSVLLTASYAGTFYLPAVSCEAMYDPTVYARQKGMEIRVLKPVGQ